jgi:hypothetical protein
MATWCVAVGFSPPLAHREEDGEKKREMAARGEGRRRALGFPEDKGGGEQV